MGPITLFDKSFLQSLSTDESVWFDNFFYPVVAPLFIIETLADLYKKPREGKTAEDEVGIIAAKTPQLHGGPCHFHVNLYISDLLGNHVPLTGQVPIAGMRRVVKDGQEGAVLEVTPEARAFSRWQDGQFQLLERFQGRAWRMQVENSDLSAIEHRMKQLGVDRKTCKTIEDALKLADEMIAGLTKSPGRFDVMLQALDVPDEVRPHVKARWKRTGHAPFATFAPYARHVLRVQLFFQIALGANLIASTRASHKVDIAYLFYLPFCSLFVSSDRLHRLCATLFLRADQEFVWGAELKPELAALNTHFAALPEDTRKEGIYAFASRLPDESQGLIRALFTRHTPNLLRPAAAVGMPKMDPERHKALVDHVKSWTKAPAVGGFTGDSAAAADGLQSMVIKRAISRTRGSWTMISDEVAARSRAAEGDDSL